MKADVETTRNLEYIGTKLVDAIVSNVGHYCNNNLFE